MQGFGSGWGGVMVGLLMECIEIGLIMGGGGFWVWSLSLGPRGSCLKLFGLLLRDLVLNGYQMCPSTSSVLHGFEFCCCGTLMRSWIYRLFTCSFPSGLSICAFLVPFLCCQAGSPLANCDVLEVY